MFHSLKQIIFSVAPYALAPPLLLGLWQFRALPGALRIITIHVLVAAVTELAATLLWHYRINNLFLLHIYTVEECGMLLWFYSYLWRERIPLRVFLYVFLSFLVFAVINSMLLQPLTQNNTYARSIEAVIMIACAIAFFYKMLSEARIHKPERSPYFWINTGLLIYFSGSLLLFTLSNYIRGPEYKQLRMDIWTLHAFFNILLYTFITIGLWKQRRK
ncbi:hypothetical protein HB364_18095 [Pseudoflavitalea sp. X16]|uniref:hypothetical protein n=1 Tax=Paraflavitalea devenefica TaxID=2716334 RepID=UPI00141E0002|nr:hypothetical protein [Paraflavitalea devenefica]NII27008.1 hypothetical protein [Paraflavitalea devenefica]